MTLQRTLFLLATAAFVAAPARPQQSTELDLFNAVARENDPPKKLALLTEWSERFPASTYARERNIHYLSCYSQLEAAAIAPAASAESQSLGERAAAVILSRADELFAANMLPESVSAANRAAARTEALRQAHATIALLATTRKDFTRAEVEYRALLAMMPDDAVVALRLGTSIVSQRNPDRYPEAIYYLARAAGRMPAGADRDSATQYLRTVYRGWHGDLADLEMTIAAAAAAKTIPDDWKILSAKEMADIEARAQADWERTHPELAAWRKIRIRLGEPDAMEYFAKELKDALLPTMKGTVTATSGTKEVSVAVDGEKADVTLHLTAAVKEKLTPGTVIAFTGVPQAFSLNPYMLVVEVKAADLKVNP